MQWVTYHRSYLHFILTEPIFSPVLVFYAIAMFCFAFYIFTFKFTHLHFDLHIYIFYINLYTFKNTQVYLYGHFSRDILFIVQIKKSYTKMYVFHIVIFLDLHNYIFTFTEVYFSKDILFIAQIKKSYTKMYVFHVVNILFLYCAIWA